MINFNTHTYFDGRLTGSIPAQYKHLCAWRFVMGLGIFIVCIYKKNKVYKYVYLSVI
jgi:hypothetical protein